MHQINSPAVATVIEYTHQCKLTWCMILAGGLTHTSIAPAALPSHEIHPFKISLSLSLSHTHTHTHTHTHACTHTYNHHHHLCCHHHHHHHHHCNIQHTHYWKYKKVQHLLHSYCGQFCLAACPRQTWCRTTHLVTDISLVTAKHQVISQWTPFLISNTPGHRGKSLWNI